MVLRDRAILVTGGSGGIGKAVATACLRAGADVAICARDSDTLDTARTELETMASGQQRVLAIRADVSDSDGVDATVSRVLAEMPNLAGLVNCAAIVGPIGVLQEVDVKDWTAAIQVNLIGTMLTCRAVLAHFQARRYGKIVNFSGGGATSPRPRFSAYAASKAAVVRFTETLAQEVEGTGISVNAVSPGVVNTRMLDEILEGGPNRCGEAAYQDSLRQKERGGRPEPVAALCVMLLSTAGDGLTGRLISAVWDPWESLAGRKDELAKSDIYTLRRIVPEDRGFSW